MIERAERAERTDHDPIADAEVAATFEAAAAATEPVVLRTRDLTPVTWSDEGTITLGGRPLGRVAALADGRVVYQVPYDIHADVDFEAKEGEVTDPEIVARVRAVVASGTRDYRHGHRTYRVTRGHARAEAAEPMRSRKLSQ